MTTSQIWINVIGTAAGLCSMASFVPQILKIWREKDASSVSLHMFGVIAASFTLWCLYGVILKSWPIIASNGVCFLLSTLIVLLRLKFGAAPKKKTDVATQQKHAPHVL